MMIIMKISKQHLLLNGNSDWAKTWWEGLGQHGDLELIKLFCYDIQNSRHGGLLKIIFNCYLLTNGKLDWAETWWMASGQYGDLEF